MTGLISSAITAAPFEAKASAHAFPIPEAAPPPVVSDLEVRQGLATAG